jgi:hypothetical protein
LDAGLRCARGARACLVRESGRTRFMCLQNTFGARKIDLGQETQKWRLCSSRVNPKITGNPFGLSDSTIRSISMNNTTLDSRTIRTASPSTTPHDDALRDLVAAMPIVIMYRAARAALMQHRKSIRSALTN